MTLGPLLPGREIGIVGGGQLGRMFAIAARRLGYRVQALDPVRDCPTGQVADIEWSVPYTDVEGARRFANHVDLVTFEFENIPTETLLAISELRPVRPSPHVLDVCRHRLREKEFLTAHGIPVAPFRAVKSAADVAAAADELGRPAVLKTATFGYDGKGQVLLTPERASEDDTEAAWRALGQPVGVVEGFMPFVRELSVIVARGHSGEMAVFDVFENEHVRHILDVTMCPARIAPSVAEEAQALGRRIAEALDLVGLLCVELFELDGGRLVVNELAPRPHNSGHLTFDAAVTSQFEQQLRAVCALPLGDPSLLRPAAMANLLGDLWRNGPPPFVELLGFSDVKLHLYGKAEARPGRKMGHLVAFHSDVTLARARVLEARAVLERAAR